jgi:hypothetical protein
MKVLAVQALLAQQQQLLLGQLLITVAVVVVEAAGTLNHQGPLLAQLEVLVVAEQVLDIHRIWDLLPVLQEQQILVAVVAVALPVMAVRLTRSIKELVVEQEAQA